MVTAALASSPASAADPAEESALLELTVNGVNKGTARVIVRGETLLVAVASLKAAGLTDVPGTPEDVDGEPYIRADALGPDIKFEYDEENLAIVLTVAPRLLNPTTIDLASSEPHDIEYIDSPSAFINYAVISENANTPSFISEQSARYGAALFSNNFSLTSDGRFIRGNTNVIIDNRTKSTRYVIGDSLSDAGLFGGVARIGGLSYATDFGLNPYVTPYPNQRFAGVVSTQSTADIYINGRLVRTVDVPPGAFNLENLPGVTGAGNIRVVVRNAFGQAQELNAPYYMGTQALRRGLHQFSYTAGFARDLALTGVGSYDDPAFAARHRYGFTDKLTLGGFFVADGDKVAAGPEATAILPFGTLGVFLAGSRQDGFTEGAAGVQYSYQSPRFSAGAAYTYTDPRYATLGLDRRDERATSRADAYVGVPIGRVSDLSFDFSHARFRDSGHTNRASVTASTRVGRRFNLALTLSHARFSGLPVDNGAFLSLTVPIGGRTTATASLDVDRMGTTGGVQVQRALPYGEGLGYLVQGSAGAQAVNFADVRYQGRYGLYQVNVVDVPGATRTTVSASGALVAIGGRVMPTRPVQDAFALIRVPNVPNVTGTLSHQDVGKTDSRGDLFVPNLLSYYGNELGIVDLDIPLDYSIAQTERAVAPSLRGGAVVVFPVKRLQAFVGTLEVIRADGPYTPAYGDLSVVAGGTTIESPIGAKGEFYLEALPAEPSVATIHYEGGRCSFTMAAPTSTERFVEMGKLTCVEK